MDHHHGHLNNQQSPPPPQPTYGGGYTYPPPSYGGGYTYPPPVTYPPPPPYGGGYPQAPPQVSVVYHTSIPADYLPPPPQQPPYEGSGDLGVGAGDELTFLEADFGNKQTYRIYCKASQNIFCVGIRDNKVVLTYANPSDHTQHWYKDEKYSTKVKDEEGYPAFSLVNKATGEALKHPLPGEPVGLVPYNPEDQLDPALLWTESKDLGNGYKTIRNVNNVQMVLDAFNGDKDHGGVHDGTYLSVYKRWKGDNQNQQWKIFPYCEFLKLCSLKFKAH